MYCGPTIPAKARRTGCCFLTCPGVVHQPPALHGQLPATLRVSPRPSTKLVCSLRPGPRDLAMPLSSVPWRHPGAQDLACHPPQRPLQHVPWAPSPRTAWEAWRWLGGGRAPGRGRAGAGSRTRGEAGARGGLRSCLRGEPDAGNQQLVPLPSLQLCPPAPCSGKRTRAFLPLSRSGFLRDSSAMTSVEGACDRTATPRCARLGRHDSCRGRATYRRNPLPSPRAQDTGVGLPAARRGRPRTERAPRMT